MQYYMKCEEIVTKNDQVQFSFLDHSWSLKLEPHFRTLYFIIGQLKGNASHVLVPSICTNPENKPPSTPIIFWIQPPVKGSCMLTAFVAGTSRNSWFGSDSTYLLFTTSIRLRISPSFPVSTPILLMATMASAKFFLNTPSSLFL